MTVPITTAEKLAHAICAIEKRHAFTSIDEVSAETARCWRRHLPEAESLMAELQRYELEIVDRQ